MFSLNEKQLSFIDDVTNDEKVNVTDFRKHYDKVSISINNGKYTTNFELRNNGRIYNVL